MMPPEAQRHMQRGWVRLARLDLHGLPVYELTWLGHLVQIRANIGAAVRWFFTT